jgi:hypothetical protein
VWTNHYQHSAASRQFNMRASHIPRFRTKNLLYGPSLLVATCTTFGAERQKRHAVGAQYVRVQGQRHRRGRARAASIEKKTTEVPSMS